MPSSDKPKPLPVYEFKFFCGMDFRKMVPIEGDERVRRCGECEKNVFLVESEEELDRRAAARQCIALGESVGAKLLVRLPEDYDPERGGQALSGEPLPLRRRNSERTRRKRAGVRDE